MNFTDLKLNTALQNAIRDMDYIYPTAIQIATFPVLLSGRDMVGLAQTGTGKTLAYLLPLLKQLKYSEQQHPRILIIVPTRELVVQVVNEIKKLTTYMNIRFAGVYGGTNINTQKKIIYAGLDIMVATPGRLYDLTLTGILRLKSIQKLVVDEVDEMLHLGFREQLLSIFDLLSDKRQNLLFSATLSADVDKLIQEFFSNPQKVEISAHGTPIEKIIQQAYHVPNYHTKINLLEHLLFTDKALQKVLVFTKSKKIADRLNAHITDKFSGKIGLIHSNKSQNQRLNAIRRFEEGEHSVLIATDIIARGLDFTDVSHVINFDMPERSGDYIHRIGRTGRADKAGTAISFINEVEQEYQMAIEEMMHKFLELLPFPEAVEVSPLFTDDEKPSLSDKNYLKTPSSMKETKGAFHEKIDKNKKTNQGGSYRRKIKAKYKKPKTRGSKRK